VKKKAFYLLLCIFCQYPVPAQNKDFEKFRVEVTGAYRGLAAGGHIKSGITAVDLK
jgi:hypothetical protein